MKKIFLSLLLFGFFAQAKLEKLPYKGDLKPEAVAINKFGIWAVAGKQRTDDKSLKDFYLVKWDDIKKDWEQIVLVEEKTFDFHTEGKLIASPGGVIFILAPDKRTLFKFLNNKLEKLYEFGDKKVSNIAATRFDNLFYTEVIKTCSNVGTKKCSFATHIKKWNPDTSAWDPYGKPLPGLWEKADAGSDRSGYIGGTYEIIKNGKSIKESKIFFWNNTDSRWEDPKIQLDPQYVINQFAVATKFDVWFHLIASVSKIELFRWDGKELKKEIEMETLHEGMIIDMDVTPGTLVAVDLAGDVFRYRYSAGMPEGIRKVYDEAPKDMPEGDVLAPPPPSTIPRIGGPETVAPTIPRIGGPETVAPVFPRIGEKTVAPK